MEGLKEFFEAIGKKGLKDYVPDPNDYEKDGETYCHVCHKKKLAYVKTPNGEKRLLPSTCDCKEAEEKLIEAKKRKDELRKACFSNPNFYNCTFDKDDGKSADIIESAKKYVRYFEDYGQRGVGILFSGGVGNGKTFATACILNALIDEGKRCKMTSLTTIGRQWTEFAKRDDILNELTSFDVIAIDDFGAERKSESYYEMVYSIVDTLLKAHKPVIYTTNITFEKIVSETQDEGVQRVNSRLYERCIPVVCRGKDRRVKKMMDLKSEFDSRE